MLLVSLSLVSIHYALVTYTKMAEICAPALCGRIQARCKMYYTVRRFPRPGHVVHTWGTPRLHNLWLWAVSLHTLHHTAHSQFCTQVSCSVHCMYNERHNGSFSALTVYTALVNCPVGERTGAYCTCKVPLWVHVQFTLHDHFVFGLTTVNTARGLHISECIYIVHCTWTVHHWVHVLWILDVHRCGHLQRILHVYCAPVYALTVNTASVVFTSECNYSVHCTCTVTINKVYNYNSRYRIDSMTEM